MGEQYKFDISDSKLSSISDVLFLREFLKIKLSVLYKNIMHSLEMLQVNKKMKKK